MFTGEDLTEVFVSQVVIETVRKCSSVKGIARLGHSKKRAGAELGQAQLKLRLDFN